MAKDPADRYQDATEMATDLRRMLRSDSPTLSGEAGGQVALAQPANDAWAATIANPPRQASSRWRLGAIAITLTVLTAAAATFLLRSPPATPPSPALAPQPSTEPKPPAAATPATPAAAKASRNATPSDKPASAQTSWRTALNADLKACSEQSVFSRIVCIEKARWKHCPGHWGTIDDCPSSMAGQKSP
jgi:hypothetical protein